MQTFYIKHDKSRFAISLETKETKFYLLERLIFLIGAHSIDKGKTKELQRILSTLEISIESKEFWKKYRNL